MARFSILVLVLFSLGLTSCARQQIQGRVISEASIGLDTGIFSLIDMELERHLNRTDLAGGQLAIAHNGRIVYTASFGENNLRSPKSRINPTTYFDITSLTKTLVASALYDLIEPGDGYAWALLQHRTGIDDEDAYSYLLELSPDRWPAVAASYKRRFLVRQVYRYSNAGYFLLGPLLESESDITSNSIEERFRASGFTEWFWDLSRHGDVAWSHERTIDTDSSIVAYDPLADKAIKTSAFRPFHSGLFSNAEAVARYLSKTTAERDWLHPADESRDERLQLMKQSRSGVPAYMRPPFGHPQGYEYRYFVQGGYTGCWAWIDRETSLVFVLLTNASLNGAQEDSRRIAESVAERLVIGSRNLPRIPLRSR